MPKMIWTQMKCSLLKVFSRTYFYGCLLIDSFPILNHKRYQEVLLKSLEDSYKVPTGGPYFQVKITGMSSRLLK